VSTYIIAEVGINHNGSREHALSLVKMAADCGCDAVKFQKRDIETVYSEEELLKPRASPWGNTTFDQKVGLELSKADYEVIRDYARSLNLDFSASAWDDKSLAFVEALKPDFHKIASAMLTKYDFVEQVAKLGRYTYISTGMCEYRQVDHVVMLFQKYECDHTLLHCVSAYPCPPDDCNLQAMEALGARYLSPVGYSGHEVGISPSIAAVAMGATVIERHITLDRAMYGSDQSASLEREGLRRMVAMIREIEVAMGDGVKRITPKEMEVAQKLRYWRQK
jgi:N-acetylneuraminate synthase